MKKIVFILSLLFTLQSFSQKTSFEWAERATIHSSSAKFQGKTILVDPFDNVYLFGVHASSNNANFNNNDMILAKYTPDGKRLWYKKFASKTYAPHGDYTMYWDDNYNIVVGGEMNSIIGGDTIDKYTSAITPTFGVVKFDSSGNYIWSTQIDANVDDEYDFIQFPNGNYALRGEGTVTYKPDSSLLIGNGKDFIAYINSNGTVNTAKEMPYTNYSSSYGTTPRKIFANGNNVASAMSVSISNSPAPGFTSAVLFEEFNWGTNSVTNTSIIKYSGIGPWDYQYDSVERALYIMGSTGLNSNIVFINNNDTINTSPNLHLIVKYDIDADTVITYEEFNVDVDFSMFSYDYGLTVVSNFTDSCKNLTLNETYYVLPVIPNGYTNQYQYLLVNFNTNLDYNYYAQYATSVGNLLLYDLTHGNNGNIYGTTNGSAQSYFDTIVEGPLGNADPTGFIFKVSDTNSQQSTAINEIKDYKEVRIFPNPTNNRLNVISNSIISRVNIIDVNGRLIKQESHKNIIDVEELNNGLYLIQFLDKQNNVIDTKRFIKQ